MKRAFCLFLGALVLLSGCTSVPRVNSAYRVEEEKYLIKIAKGYAQQPKEFKYAVNSFVKEQGQTSYDIITDKRGRYIDYYVVMPGSTPVEDLPRVKHFHKGKTVAAIVAPLASAGVVGVIAGWMVFVARVAGGHKHHH